MTDTLARCIFCRAPLGADHAPSVEHVIPRALGGWLTIHCVCKPCNDRLGLEVDRIVNTQLFLALRREVGLGTGRALEGSYVIRDLGREVRGLINADGTVSEQRRVWEDDKRAEIIAETAEEARAQAARLNARRARVGLPPLEFGEATFLPSQPVHVAMGPLKWEAGQFESLLAREAAKITVDYVGYLGGCEAALDPRLDALRACALDGTTDVRLRRKNIVPTSTRAIYLPRGQNIFGMSARRADVPSLDELRRLLPDPASDQALPSTVVELKHFFHVLRVRHEDSAGVIDVTLFNLFVVGFELPADLNIPWPAADIRDFTEGKILRERPER